MDCTRMQDSAWNQLLPLDPGIWILELSRAERGRKEFLPIRERQLPFLRRISGSRKELGHGKCFVLENKESGEPESKIPREDEEEEPVKHREIKLRNYDPEDEELKKRKLPPAKPASVEDTVKEQLEAAKPEPIIDEVDLANLAPRKPDWDLKRDVSKKLEKLEKRTQRAIAELIRERLKGQEGELASAVGSAKQEGSDSD
ncbi:coiled-coil domain-containing protein 12 [Motacilla alba alba]|nr:coiled-coil domain-containing protein 12 [Motacilla alba alba]